MKTLDEVISTLERCTDWNADCKGCPYREENTGGLECEMRNLEEVLHYLKEYKQDCADLVEAAKSLTKKEHESAKENLPLTWDELKEMTGKPVWVEIGDDTKLWVIIRKINEAGILFGSDGFIGIECLYGMDATWKAYRKEVK